MHGDSRTRREHPTTRIGDGRGMDDEWEGNRAECIGLFRDAAHLSRTASFLNVPARSLFRKLTDTTYNLYTHDPSPSTCAMDDGSRYTLLGRAAT